MESIWYDPTRKSIFETRKEMSTEREPFNKEKEDFNTNRFLTLKKESIKNESETKEKLKLKHINTIWKAILSFHTN